MGLVWKKIIFFEKKIFDRKIFIEVPNYYLRRKIIIADGDLPS